MGDIFLRWAPYWVSDSGAHHSCGERHIGSLAPIIPAVGAILRLIVWRPSVRVDVALWLFVRYQLYVIDFKEPINKINNKRIT
jgi:hypothetical protein